MCKYMCANIWYAGSLLLNLSWFTLKEYKKGYAQRGSQG